LQPALKKAEVLRQKIMQEDLTQVEKNPQEILFNNIKLIPLHSVQKNGSKTS
jgi:hypothetical protein